VISDRPEQVRAFLNGATAGWKAAFSDRDLSVKAILPFAEGATADSFRKRLDLTFDLIGTNSGIYPGLWPFDRSRLAATLAMLRQFGDLEREVELDTAFSNSFLS
jgi:hypothetical protein